MHVCSPTLQIDGDVARIATEIRVAAASFPFDSPIEVWYEFPAAYANQLTARSDGFVVALLPLAMYYRENMVVDAPLSPRLARGLREFQHIFSTWFDAAHPITITADYATEAASPPAGGTGTLFSGGVDSFFTLQAHLPPTETNPGYQITHGLFLQGFDIGLGHDDSFQASFDAYAALFEHLNVTLIPVRTNLKRYIHRGLPDWTPALGSILISAPLMLQGLLTRCYIPSSYTYTDIKHILPETHPLTDHLCSTEQLQLVHDGAWATRVEKTASIADWPATHDHLCVCPGRQTEEAPSNCGQCEKCILTMIALDLLGALNDYSTFSRSLQRCDVRGWRLHDYDMMKPYVLELKELAERTGRSDMVRDLQYVLFTHRIRSSVLGRFARTLFVEPAKQSAFLRRLYHRYVR